MKNKILIFISVLMLFPIYMARADYCGCDALSVEEMEKAENVLSSAKEILLFENTKPQEISFADIDFTTDENSLEFGRFSIKDNSYAATDFFVYSEISGTYQNLGLIIGCKTDDNRLLKEIGSDKIYISMRDKFMQTQKRYQQCEELYGNVQNSNLTEAEECYLQTLSSLFKNCHLDNADKYKKNFDNYLTAYETLLRDIYTPTENYDNGTVVEDYIAAFRYTEIKKVVAWYMNETAKVFNLEQE